MKKGPLLIIFAIIIILIVAVVFILPQMQNSTGGTTTTDNGDGVAVVQLQPTVGPTMTPLAFVELVIAVQELPRGFRIPANAVDLRPWPEQSAPDNAITNLDDVIGKIARTRIFREQPILSAMITDDFTSLAEVGSDAAAMLPSGVTGIAVPIDRQTSVAYAVQPGDRVDVLLSMLFVDVDDAFQTLQPNTNTLFLITQDGIEFTQSFPGRPTSTTLGPTILGPSERQRPRLVTQRTIQNALVMHVGDYPLDGKLLGLSPTPTPAAVEETSDDGTPMPTATPHTPDIVTLGVSPQEAVVLGWAIEARLPIMLTLRSATDTSRTNTQDVNLDYIMSTFGIDAPTKRPIAIEPAIRSIRQLLIGNEIQLTTSTDQ